MPRQRPQRDRVVLQVVVTTTLSCPGNITVPAIWSRRQAVGGTNGTSGVLPYCDGRLRVRCCQLCSGTAGISATIPWTPDGAVTLVGLRWEEAKAEEALKKEQKRRRRPNQTVAKKGTTGRNRDLRSRLTKKEETSGPRRKRRGKAAEEAKKAAASSKR